MLLIAFATLFLFSGALAFPLLVEHEIVRVGSGNNAEFGTHGGNELVEIGAASGFRTPRALVTTPGSSGDAAFRVGWDNEGPDAALVYAFHVQYAAVSVGEEGEASWNDWFRLRRSDLPREATFTGAPGESYAFRARTCDLAVSCGPWSDAAATQVLADAAEPLIDLDVVLRSPATNDTVDGRVAIAWDYDHRGPGSALIEVLVRPHGHSEWTPLYSGSGLSAVWDTTRHDDGGYILRLKLSDGIHHVHQEIPVRVANDPAVPQPLQAEPTEEAAEEERAESARSPAVPMVVALIVIGLVVVHGRRML